MRIKEEGIKQYKGAECSTMRAGCWVDEVRSVWVSFVPFPAPTCPRGLPSMKLRSPVDPEREWRRLVRCTPTWYRPCRRQAALLRARWCRSAAHSKRSRLRASGRPWFGWRSTRRSYWWTLPPLSNPCLQDTAVQEACLAAGALRGLRRGK